ncbi:hypothetical protein HMPREF3227_01213 [Corynebacterium sp. CMW7794]|uniref:hypothetical protein n=1 Tax=Corynebacterium TaxID=1716 RepID=UPI0007937118|nr:MULTISPECIES: hypothetical protein [Corynebacterium]KXI18076.1 hypothetical protein HMPREF3227_01213 [Corynebacterium sp. CMW7794]MBF9010197.1 hypothetical protein [Corynebacterium phoceense]
MAKRNDAETQDIAAQLQPLVDDDAFLTELSLGNDPSAGDDPLAALFLELRDEVEAPMPPAPVVEGADQEPEVISLAAARRRRRVSPWASGLIGAAAATVLLAGSGAVIYNAGPGSPLHGLNESVFGKSQDAAEVELASSLEEMQDKVAQGDIEGARAVLSDTRKKLKDPSPEVVAKLEAAEKRLEQQRSQKITVTVTVTPPASDAPSSTAEPGTVTQTLVQTETVQAPSQGEEGIGSTEPSVDGGTSATQAPEPLQTETAVADDPNMGVSNGGNSGNAGNSAADAVRDANGDRVGAADDI